MPILMFVTVIAWSQEHGAENENIRGLFLAVGVVLAAPSLLPRGRFSR
jgi:hypothetical protein